MADVKGAIGKAEDAIKGAVKAAETEVEKVAGEVIKFFRMVRDPSVYPAPHDATVHPAEVDNMRAGGWITEDEAKAAAAARKAAADLEAAKSADPAAAAQAPAA